MANNKFVNPYNFVPFGEKNKGNYDASKDEKTYSGMMEYTITTKTPLFIPNTSSEHAFRAVNLDECTQEEHLSYDFFSYKDLGMLQKKSQDKTFENEYQMPVIPGSSVRGVIRNIYETLTGSCMGAFNEDERISIRTQEIFKPAVLKKANGKNGRGQTIYYLMEAEDCILRRKADGKGKDLYKPLYLSDEYKEGQKLEFAKRPRKNKYAKPFVDEKGKGTIGYVIKGMRGPENIKEKKHNIHVLVPKTENTKKLPSLTEEQVRMKLGGVIKAYQSNDTEKDKTDKNPKAYSEYKKAYEEFLAGKEQYLPVYYSILKEGKSEILYLSPAMRTRELSHKTIGEIAKEYCTCRSKKEACPACRLFGMAGKDNTESIASKLRFTDSYVKEEKDFREYYDSIVTLAALGTPKLQNVEFYLKKPNKAKFWTYDYHVIDQGNKEDIVVQDAKLRGRKYYWHQPNVKLIANLPQTNLNKTIRPVKKEQEFCGKLYFDAISKKQLDQLIWIMNCGNDQNLGYKIGGGKPLGLGSVVFRVNRITARTVSEQNGVPKVDYAEIGGWKNISEEDLDFDEEVLEAFKKICNLHIMDGKKICYAYTEGQNPDMPDEGFKWFASNHELPKKLKRKLQNITYSLPDIMDKEQELPVLSEKKNIKPAGNRRGNKRTYPMR